MQNAKIRCTKSNEKSDSQLIHPRTLRNLRIGALSLCEFGLANVFISGASYSFILEFPH